jgi:CubicO group peptidase (beta-lactamase class C family)
MKKWLLIKIALYTVLSTIAQSSNYFPGPDSWEKRSPAAMGVDSIKLRNAIQFAIENESKNPRSMEQNHLRSFAKEPFGEAIGPFADRGAETGLIIYKGYIIAQWGEPGRVDMTHSVTKSFLSTTVGLALEKGLIKKIDDTVPHYISSVISYEKGIEFPDSLKVITPFSSPHNKKLTWEVMLRQTSDWEGTLWGKPDWADRPDPDSARWHNRIRNEPGTVFEYNDVRVNALALATTWVWQRALPDVLNEFIMTPIGASTSWKWEGYRTSWIKMGDKKIQTVSGGGHWGGGMFINAYDMARFGSLTLHKGKWNGKQLIPVHWIEKSATPTKANKGYGYMNYFLNTDKNYLPAAPASAFVHVGNGTNIIYVDRDHQLVMVVRWIENNAINELVKKVLNSIR